MSSLDLRKNQLAPKNFNAKSQRRKVSAFGALLIE